MEHVLSEVGDERVAPPRDTIGMRYKVMAVVAPLLSFLPIPLFSLLQFSHTDKQSSGGHQYGKTYHRVLKRFKYKPVRFLEIGIGGYHGRMGGGSLSCWRSFFPFGRIIGADIVDKRALKAPGVSIHILDQSKENQLTALHEAEGPFDIVLDDGSHINEHQIETFKILFPKLKDKGVYIIEDIQTSYWDDLGGFPVGHDRSPQTCMGWFAELSHYVNYPEFRDLSHADDTRLDLGKMVKGITFEHNLIIIEKDTAARQSNAQN
ncbi:MAG: class I SAM-dependent methyltransferase [Pseudomonadota bacterium]